MNRGILEWCQSLTVSVNVKCEAAGKCEEDENLLKTATCILHDGDGDFAWEHKSGINDWPFLQCVGRGGKTTKKEKERDIRDTYLKVMTNITDFTD